MMTRKNDTARRKGMTTMELALLLPFIMIFVTGMIEMGTLYYSWMTVQKAAQSGARFAASGVGEEEGNRLALIEEVTSNWLGGLEDGGKQILIRSWPAADGAGDGIDNDAGGPCQLVEVKVLFDYHPFTPVIGAALPETITLSGVDRKLNEPWKSCGG